MMKRPESVEELKDLISMEVFTLFAGMDEEYKTIIQPYKKAQVAGKYSVEYLSQLKKETVDQIHELMTSRKALAFAKLDEINALYEVIEDVIPVDVQGANALLVETKRANAMKLIDTKIKTAKDAKEVYLDLIKAYQNDEFLVQYLDAKSEELPETQAILIQQAFNETQANPFSAVIQRNKAALTTLLSPKSTKYPSYLFAGVEGPNKYVNRDIIADLDLSNRINEGWKHTMNTDQSGVE